ncbi:MAG: M13 family metallopeptidase [Ferroplasma sp.]
MVNSESILKRNIGFSPDYMNKNFDATEDFYSFCNGKWLEETKIPKDRSRYGSFDMLYEKNMHILNNILERSSKAPESPLEKQLGDFYKSAMNTRKLEAIKFRPVSTIIKKIDEMDRSRLPELLAYLSLNGVDIFFNSETEEDAKNTEIYALYILQGGISLPDRDYYLDSKMKQILDAYKVHIANMFALYGYSREEAEKSASNVIKIESALAKFSRSKTDLRDVEKAYNRMELDEIDSKYSEFGFKKYFSEISSADIEYAIIDAPEFFSEADAMLKTMPEMELKEYFKWKALNSYAPLMHNAAVKENFNFFKKALLGQEKIAPRWRTAVNIIDGSIGDSLGYIYVRDHFGKEAENKISILIDDLKSIFKERLEKNPWMGAETRERALKKFSKFTTKIGYPKKLKDYSSIEIKPDDYAGNVVRSMLYEQNRQLSRIGKEVDRSEWFMTPPTVNAYFNPMGNEIVFPAGIMQPPFFDAEMDDPVNYGGIGSVIAHEITHGYDDQGSHFDENGNMANWWLPDDKKRFDELAAKVVDMYQKVEILPGFHINGKLTLGENIADLGAVLIAYDAMQRRLKAEPSKNILIDGFTPEQRFFISWGQIWRTKIRDNEAKRLATIDPHSPGSARGTLPAWNHPDFNRIFSGKIEHNCHVIMW